MGSRVAFVVVVSLLVVACGGASEADVRRRAWVEAHPELSAQVCDAVLAGRLVPEIGMTRGDVLASAGEPTRREKIAPPRLLDPGFERWVYVERDQVAVFQEGVLVTVYRLSIVRPVDTGAASLRRTAGGDRRA